MKLMGIFEVELYLHNHKIIYPKNFHSIYLHCLYFNVDLVWIIRG